jgi:hypothetical protein
VYLIIEIQAKETGQKDALLRSANILIKKKYFSKIIEVEHN